LTIDVGTIMKEYDPRLHGIIPEADWMRMNQRKNSSGETINKPYIIDLYAEQASADAAANVIEDLDAELDGLSSAISIYTYTKDAKDTAAGVGAQEVTALGIVANEYKEGSVATAGLNTQSASVLLASVQRLITAKVTAVGTELDNAAEIDITNNAQAATYRGIQAGENDLRGCTFYIAPGYRCKVAKLIVRNSTAAGAGKLANTIVEGVRICLVQTAADFNKTAHIPTHIHRTGLNLYGGIPDVDIAKAFPEVFPLNGVDTGIVTLNLNIESFDDGDHTTCQYFMRLLVWREE